MESTFLSIEQAVEYLNIALNVKQSLLALCRCSSAYEVTPNEAAALIMSALSDEKASDITAIKVLCRALVNTEL